MQRAHAIRHPRLDWTALRDRWECSHVVRAALAMAALVLLVIAVTGRDEIAA